MENPIDQSRIDRISGNNPEIEEKLFMLFRQSAETSLEKMHQALEEGDTEAWRQAAHSLKGASGNMGAQRMYELCTQARDIQARSLLDELHGEYAKIKAYMQTRAR